MRLATLLSIFVTVFSIHADVISWRNGGNGEYLNSRLPLNWNENILWKTPLENWSNASPILVGDRLYFTQEPSTLLCSNTATGDILWKREINQVELLGLSEEEKAQAVNLREQSEAYRKELNRLTNDLRRLRRRSDQDPTNEQLKQEVESLNEVRRELNRKRRELTNNEKFGVSAVVPSHRTNGYASFTPISDGKRVYTSFGQGMLVAYDFEGNEVWKKRMNPPDHSWGGSTSPLIVDGKLIVRFDDYVALDPNNGQELWRTPSEVVFGTPSVFKVEGQSFLFTPRGEVIRISDGTIIQDGLVILHKEYPWSVMGTPAIENGVIFTARGMETGGADGHVHALRVPSALGELFETGLRQIWHQDVHAKRYYASPIVHEGLVYVISADFVLTALEADSGEKVYEKKIEGLRGTAYTGLTLAGDTLFFASDQGILVAAALGREYKELGRSQFEQLRSTPIFQNNIAYLRTYENLYAIKAN